MNRLLGFILFAVIPLILIFMLMIQQLDHHQRITSVNISQIIQDFSTKVASLHGSDDDKKKLSESFSKALSASIDEYAKTHNQTIFVNKAIASNVLDVTGDIESDVFKKIKLL
ncbi:type-F conjugative transfer system protein TrbI [Thiotrichales bacterium 19S3-7]|nr:type-F conjugative transfer system protein TrbI [Thiotrichales bacterium 19S3-7]MCF6802246.1 type-F conjugative transfer system protein TrbI [Thiotrichales bacterium 19S3-11]